jgi:hypothetical protein
MENIHHKGTELNNVQETWNVNEKLRASENTGATAGNAADEAPAVTALEKIIKQEASEYDNENKENRLLGGDRATVNDVEDTE